MAFNNNTQNVSPRRAVEMKIVTSRMNLLLVAALTLINVILLLCGSDTYMLFSATVPYVLVLLGMTFCGKMPEAYYKEVLGGEIPSMDAAFLWAMAFVAVVIVAAYVFCWYAAKKRPVLWLTVAAVLFGIDCVLLVITYGFNVGMVLDYLMHIWVMYYLIVGVTSGIKLKKLPPEEEPAPVQTATSSQGDGFFGENIAAEPVQPTQDEVKTDEQETEQADIEEQKEE